MSRRPATLGCVVGAVAAIGCAVPRVPLDRAALLASAPRTLVVAQSRGPRISAEGMAKAGPGSPVMIGLIGVAAALARADAANHKRVDWMKWCGVEDPVDEIREGIADDLATALSLRTIESDRVTDANAPEDVINDYAGADLILDVRTSKWGIHQVRARSPNSLVHFAVGYEGTVRLIDARRRAVIAEGRCEVQFSNEGDLPTLAELVADDCALLDKGLTLSAQTCAKRHRALLGLE